MHIYKEVASTEVLDHFRNSNLLIFLCFYLLLKGLCLSDKLFFTDIEQNSLDDPMTKYARKVWI